MALAVILRGSCRLPTLTNTASKLMASKTLNSKLVLTPIVARNFTALSKPISENQTILPNTQLAQSRSVSHATIWAAEKALSAALLGIIPVAVAFPSPVMDNVLAVAVVLHMHWGVEAVVVDYIRPIIFGNTFPKIARMWVYMLSALTLGGLMYFNFNDIGIAQALRKFWAIKQ